MLIEAAALDHAAAWAALFGKKATSLHRGQVEFCDHPAQKKVGCWGRRCGKSLALGEVLIPRWAIKHPGTDIYILSRTQAQANIIFEYMLGVLGPGTKLDPLVDSLRWAPFPVLTLRDGTRITAKNLAYGGRNVRGFSADLIVIDESAFVPDLVMEEAVYPLLAASPIAESVEISTPNGLNHFYKSWQDGRPGSEGFSSGRVMSWRLPTWANPFVNRQYLRDQMRRISSLAWKVEYGAIFEENQGAQFPATLIERCLRSYEPSIDDRFKAKGKPLDIPAMPEPGHRYVAGYDPADTHDRSAWVMLGVQALPWTVVDIADLKGVGYVSQKDEAVNRATRYNDAEVLVDETNNRAHLHHMQSEYGRAFGFIFSNASKRELIDNLRVVMEQTCLVIPFRPMGHEEGGTPQAIDDLLRELRFYRRDKTRTGLVRLGAPEGEEHFDDYTTALALACWQAQHPVSQDVNMNFMDW